MLKLCKKKERTNKKLSLSELVWFGFNYTVGVTFTAVFATLLYGVTGATLGTHMIWIFLVCGLIAGTCAWAFARLSRVHPGNNGAAYIYVRSSYGRFWGWIIAFVQYSTLPVIVTSQIISMIRINFTDDKSFLFFNLGVWSNFGLDLIGIVVYGLASCVLFLGMKWFKTFVNISAYLKWATTALLMIAVIILFALAGNTNFENVINHQSLTASNFSMAFTTCFFFFLGFETYSTIGKNVINPQKNISLSIIIVMALSTIFYVVVTILMIGGVTGIFSDNPNLQVFNELGSKAHSKLLGDIGIVVMLICTISLKANAGMQNALYSGGILEPLSIEGYIPAKYKELNKDNIAFRASILNLIITFIFAFIWLIIPDLVQAITDTMKGITSAKDAGTVINYGTITGEASLIMIIIYVFVISIALKLAWQKKMRHNKFEVIIWVLSFGFLVWQLVMWFVGLVNGFIGAIADIHSTVLDPNRPTLNTIDKLNAAGVTQLTSEILQIVYIMVVFMFAISWYFLYYAPKLKLRIASNQQAQFDNDFRIKDDWAFVAKNMQSEIENYLIRNVLINGNNDNPNYQFAKNVRKELLSSEGEWREDEE